MVRKLLCVAIPIAVMAYPVYGQVQERIVSGTVIDAITTRPIEGAYVTIVGTRLAVATSATGRFVILLPQSLPKDVTLEVQRIGYRTIRQPASAGQNELRVAITEVAITLDEVVVTGTAGETEKRALGNTIGVVKAEKVLEKASIGDVHQLLNGRVAGLDVAPAQGNIGTGSLIRIRGVSSMALTNQPLVYVDGVRIDSNPRTGPSIRNGRQISRLDDFNPEDIDRIEVLKGPAAATLYGTEASRGVIHIITKRGTPGPARFDISIKNGVNWFMNPEGRLPWLYRMNRDTGVLDSLHLYQRELAEGRHIFQNGESRSISLRLRGGSDVVRYYLSGGLDHDGGIVSYNWRDRMTATANIQVLPLPFLEVRTHVGFVHSNTRLAQAAEGWGVVDNIIQGNPDKASSKSRGFRDATPDTLALISALDGIDRITGSAEIRHAGGKWLTQRLTIGGDISTERSSVLFPRDARGGEGPFGELSIGDKQEDGRNFTYATVDYALSGTWNASGRLRATTSLGLQYYSKTIVTVSARGRGFPDASVTTLAGAASTTASGDRLENKGAGIYLQEQLGFNNRLFLIAALRADDNSAFGSNFSFVTYPKLSASWVVNEEPFWKPSFISTLKLRTAWGTAGQQPDVFAAARSYVPATGEDDVPTLTPQNVGNPDLQPERGQELESGFDAGFFQDRVMLSATYYDQRTKDAIVPRQVQPSLGIPGTQLVNLGEVRNWGIELQGDARLVQKRLWSASLGFTLAHNQNRILDMGGLPDVVVPRYPGSGDAQLQREGYPLGSFFRRIIVSAELDSELKPINVLCRGGDDPRTPPVPCADAMPVYVGQPTPSWLGSLTASASIANLQFYASVDFRSSYIQDNATSGALINQNRTARSVAASTDPIAIAYVDSILPWLGGDPTVVNMMKGGFAKLREVSAAYTLPKRLAQQLRASSATIAVAGRNLATLWQAQSEMFGVPIMDPEQKYGDLGNSSELSGFARFTLPQLAQVVVTLRCTF
jgi:TonB-linked SusC/RagA family outer membrane protein